jgi:hypothetical protein
MVFQQPELSADIVNVVGIDEKGGAVVVDIQVRDYLIIYPPKRQKISFLFILYCEGRKELAHTTVRLQLQFYSLKVLAHFSSKIIGGFLHVTDYCLSGAIIVRHISRICI